MARTGAFPKATPAIRERLPLLRHQIGERRIRRIEAEERLHLRPQFRRHAMALEVLLALLRSEVGHLTEQYGDLISHNSP